MKIVLASTSVSRKKILKKLGVPFLSVPPHCDETPLPNEDPVSLVLRLSKIKAESVSGDFSNSLIIGADQVGVVNGELIGKPLTETNARLQLQYCSGKTVNFYTGLTVINTNDNHRITLYEPFQVTFRSLTFKEINAYVKKEQPLHCAGSFNCDELGITLFDQLQGNDINTLIGLPLLKLNKIMIELGFNPLMQ